jgi:hypothetical protein
MEPLSELDYSGIFHERLLKEYKDFTLIEKRKTSLLFRAFKSDTETPRLIKVFDPNSPIAKNNTVYYVECFVKKIYLLLRYEHNNILQVLDCDLDLANFRLFAVFPYYPTLNQILQSSPEEIAISKLFGDIRAALEYARRDFDVTHGTLRPELIYYDRATNNYKLSNLTLPMLALNEASKDHEAHRKYLSEIPKEYMTPEVKAEEINLEQLDVFLVGLVLIECLQVERKNFLYLQQAVNDAKFYKLILQGILGESSETPRGSEKDRKTIFNMLQREPSTRLKLADISFEN